MIHNKFLLKKTRLKIFLIIVFSFTALHIHAKGSDDRLPKHIVNKLKYVDEHLALNHFEQALTILEDLESYEEYLTSDILRLYHNYKKSISHEGIGNFEKAIDLLEKGLIELENNELEDVKHDELLDLRVKYCVLSGKIFRKNKDYPKSNQYFRRVLPDLEELRDTINVLSLYHEISFNFWQAKNIDSAVLYSNKIADYHYNSKSSKKVIEEITKLEKLELKRNNEKLITERHKIENERIKRERAQISFYATSAILFIGLILSYVLHLNYRLKQQNKINTLKNDANIMVVNAMEDTKEKNSKEIASILHDSVSASLSSVNLHLQSAKLQLKDQVPQEIDKALSIVDEASVKIRDLSHKLISSILLKFGLELAVQDVCQKYSNSEISIHSYGKGIKRYDQFFEIKIFNIIQELINNILKHSKASNASIILVHTEIDSLKVRITDDGVGFNVKEAYSKDSIGLSHIEMRIKAMKGEFNIISSKNNGTNIFINLPVQFSL